MNRIGVSHAPRLASCFSLSPSIAFSLPACRFCASCAFSMAHTPRMNRSGSDDTASGFCPLAAFSSKGSEPRQHINTATVQHATTNITHATTTNHTKRQNKTHTTAQTQEKERKSGRVKERGKTTVVFHRRQGRAGQGKTRHGPSHYQFRFLFVLLISPRVCFGSGSTPSRELSHYVSTVCGRVLGRATSFSRHLLAQCTGGSFVMLRVEVTFLQHPGFHRILVRNVSIRRGSSTCRFDPTFFFLT